MPAATPIVILGVVISPAAADIKMQRPASAYGSLLEIRQDGFTRPRAARWQPAG
jgi:hypothetical protein